jgi:hypothetical protein
LSPADGFHTKANGSVKTPLGLIVLLVAMLAVPPARAGDSVSLTFAWSAPVHGAVATTLQETSRWVEMKLDKAITISGRFEMHADRSPDGSTHARFGNPELTVAAGTAGKATLGTTELVPLLPSTFGASAALSRDGTVLRVEDADEFRSTLIDLVTKDVGEAAQREPLVGYIAKAIAR